jgi:glycine oxidase
MTNRKNILIIGAGLAGSSIAHRLIQQNQNVKIIDKGENFATSVAAGMVNPMVFRRMNKSWRLDEFIFEAKAFYSELEETLKTKLLHEVTIRRLFSSEQERKSWLEKQFFSEFENYLTPISAEDEKYEYAKNNFGSGRVKNAFWIDSSKFYDSNLAYFKEKGILLKETFSTDDFNPEEGIYKGEKYDQIVFCCGYLNKEIPFFSSLPVQQTKGQLLTLKSNQIPDNESLNRKCFVLPLGNGTFKVGATYEWNNTNLEVTTEGRNLLLQNLSVLGDFKLEVLDQNSGIRPTTPDRRPIMGRHPEFSKLHVFNGLGTKGYMTAPTLSREFVAFLIDGKALNLEVSNERFN